MAKDMHQYDWDEATITKLKVFEQLIHKWLNIVLKATQKFQSKQIEIHDVFCGSGFDGSNSQKGSPLVIIDALMKRDIVETTINVHFNDINKTKVVALKSYIEEKGIDKKLEASNINIFYSTLDVVDYEIKSKSFFKLIFLDQYGIEYSQKIEKFIDKGVDILMFISSGHIKRFKSVDSFKRHLGDKIKHVDFEGKNSYETHKVISEYFRWLYPEYKIGHFSLVKNNSNTNGLIFFSTNQRGQEKFLEAAWSVDTDGGEGNKNLTKDLSRDKETLFYNLDEPTSKEENFIENLRRFLAKWRSNLDVREFSLNGGFLPKHTNKFLSSFNDLECQYFNVTRGFHLSNDKEIKVEMRIKT